MNEAFEICQLFLVPSAIFFGALAVARTEILKASVSFTAFLMNIVWIAALLGIEDVENMNSWIACSILAWGFLIAWFACLFVHGVLTIDCVLTNDDIRSDSKLSKLAGVLRKFDG